ncbi:MAG: type II toxin-antitoxin system VapB family antitoxin [Algoriphagus sp.]|jgi:Arc/MetJ family transcription regulator|uniref:type II toxin-antitoxin system VapB family antitoxin n=1 Tax=Algoriphagus sp. TaxID=1872435 RepID=UPI0027265A73|nr:type II toxin-antitoxin system VapB family antitoxin [Algoriphagus sp.]MDO8967925.1 type II toxin-antitoxin system VapB family antitoxin [Algoriphagus sp.]MDP2042911.1 type II toxin-antitoxin system VapB family antitoxin [Algoriphagus sp.]MDP3200602.1 type II toxin-antitoxin system VapB family antitoxin [Algoriphagus sp.]MDP3473985.1 type II toxin-antitoxin system VapB family antitoxin [Algoriphagus sp.]
MRTTIEIPEELLEEVMKLTGATTKSQAIKLVLEEKIAQTKRKRIIKMKGSIDLDLDLDVLRDR